MCEICFIRRKSESTESVADFVTTAGAVGNGTQDLRTRHAVSDNKRKSGLGMPSPYIPEREQIQDRKAGLKRETENCGRCTQRPYHSPLPAHPLPAREGEITAEQVATSAVHHTPSARRTGVCSPHKAQMDIQSIF